MKHSFYKVLIISILITGFFQSCTNDNETDPENSDILVLSDKTATLILTWNNLWLDLDKNTNSMRPNSTARALAYIHLTAYETAVHDMEGFISNKDRLEDFDIDLSQIGNNVNNSLALNTAYAIAFDHFMFSVSNNEKAKISLLQNEQAQEISQNLSSVEIEDSINWGTYVAERVIAYSQTDVEAEQQQLNPAPNDYVAPVGDGLWVAAQGENAWFPYWRNVRTFVVSPDQTTSVAPSFVYSTSSDSDYYSKMDEVNIIATNCRIQNDEDLWIAEFWSDDVEGLMISPVGRQFSIAHQMVIKEDLNYERTLELFLRLGFAINDAAVSAWDDKYTYNTQRPSTYITQNINPDFITNLSRFITSPNPAFPSYPSGHATFAGVSAGVFKDFFTNDSVDFTDYSHDGSTDFNGTPRVFNSFSEMAAENAYSRVPLGVHIQADSDEGLRLGYEIAEAIKAFDLSN